MLWRWHLAVRCTGVYRRSVWRRMPPERSHVPVLWGRWIVGWESLSSEAKLDAAYLAATQDMSAAYVAVLRQLAPGVRVHQGFCLWRMARDALIRQELRRGRALDDARCVAAERMLQIDHDSTA